MTTPHIVPVFTTAGMRAVFRENEAALEAKITHIGVSEDTFAVVDADGLPLASAQAMTELPNEVARIPIAGGGRVGDQHLHASAIADGEAVYWVNALGYYLADGTLLCVWSSEEGPLAWKPSGQQIVLLFDMSLVALPPGSVTVQATGDLNLHLAEELALQAAVSIAAQHRFMAQDVATLDHRWR